MSKLTFLFPVLDALSDGRIIRKSIALALRVFGVLGALSGLIAFVVILKNSFDRSVAAETTVGTLLMWLVLLAGLAGIIQICFYRSRTVAELGDAPFTVIPIVSILFRWLGEVYATMLASLGVGGCLFMWIANVHPLAYLGALGALAPAFRPSISSAFLSGVLWLAAMTLAAFVALLAAYFAAEGILVVVDIARNLRTLVDGEIPERPVARAAMAAATASAYSPAPPPPLGAVILCPVCGGPVDPNSPVCPSCASRP